jgi:hypothetical protein
MYLNDHLDRSGSPTAIFLIQYTKSTVCRRRLGGDPRRAGVLGPTSEPARTVALLTERLDHHRGRGQQQITVKHVTTNNVTADQAIIADSVTTGVGAPRSVASPALLTANSEAPMPILSEARQPLVGVGGVEKKK